MVVWSFVLAVLSLATMWLIGQKLTIGWLAALLLQGLWLVYAVITRQWGFIISALAFAIMHAYNWRKWRRDDRRVNREGVRISS